MLRRKAEAMVSFLLNSMAVGGVCWVEAGNANPVERKMIVRRVRAKKRCERKFIGLLLEAECSTQEIAEATLVENEGFSQKKRKSVLKKSFADLPRGQF